MTFKSILTGGLLASLVATTAQAASVASKADVDGVRDAAFAAVESMGMEAAMAHMGDPSNGMLDLAGAGLHTFAVTRNHIIVFDHSGQTDSGMDLSEFLMPDGRPITTWLVDWAEAGPNGGGGVMDFPHPGTSEPGEAYFTCRFLTDGDTLLCAGAWNMTG
ncbi:hypothetical protein [Aliiroseovarius sp.]|uniref:hypothetical protein n=1 Tax=Aliiroseovarius sp. TaxID=1872442 RepID=UPI003BAB6801